MSFNYSGMKATADKLISKFGIDVLFFDVESKKYDPINGRQKFTTSDEYTRKAVSYPVNITSDTESQKGEFDVRLIAQSGPYKKNNLCVWEGKKYSITAIEPIKPGDTECCVYVFLQS